MCKPNLFIVGAAKAGTTSLYHYLATHSDIYMSPIKEPGFFCTDIRWENFKDSYQKSTYINLKQYFSSKKLPNRHIAFLNDEHYYLRLFKTDKRYKYKGEASTAYLYSKNAATEIYKFNPQAKIIIILREPVERVLSHYQMDTANTGSQNEESLKKSIEYDYHSDEKGWGITHLYVELSLYYEQIKRYLEVFPRENILFLDFNELKYERKTLLREMFNFLDLESIKQEDMRTNFNKTLVPRNLIVTQSLKLKNIIPSNLREIIKKRMSFLFKSRDDIPVTNETIRYISSLVQEDWKSTQKLIGINIKG